MPRQARRNLRPIACRTIARPRPNWCGCIVTASCRMPLCRCERAIGSLRRPSAARAAQLAPTRVPPHRPTEAELVRMHRDGELPNAALPVRARDLEPPPHVVSDPALARALDLLKGLSVVQQFRAN